MASLSDRGELQEIRDIFLKRTRPKFYVPPRADIAIRKGLEVAYSRISWANRYGHETLEQTRLAQFQLQGDNDF